MPTNRTRRCRTQKRLDDFRRQQLLEGPDGCLLAGVGYFAAERVARAAELTPLGREAMIAEMRADWERYGPELMVWWDSGDQISSIKPWTFVARHGGLPWAAEQFGVPTPH